MLSESTGFDGLLENLGDFSLVDLADIGRCDCKLFGSDSLEQHPSKGFLFLEVERNVPEVESRHPLADGGCQVAVTALNSGRNRLLVVLVLSVPENARVQALESNELLQILVGGRLFRVFQLVDHRDVVNYPLVTVPDFGHNAGLQLSV